jgi:hypothetical protein
MSRRHRVREGGRNLGGERGHGARRHDRHRNILEIIDERLARLLGGDNEQDWIPPEALVPDEVAGEPRILGGPHISAAGWDPGMMGPRFDRVDVGSVGTHGVHPISSVDGANYGIGATHGSAREHMLIERARQQPGVGVDQAYADWRDRQIAQLDRDYEDYRREHQSRFNREFGDWRERRQRRRGALAQVRPKMEVKGSDGEQLGTVDRVRDDSILLSPDEADGGRQHEVPCAWIEIVDVAVILDRSADQARQAWREEERDRSGGESARSSGRTAAR